MCHEILNKFHEDWFEHLEVDRRGHTDNIWDLVCLRLFFQNEEIGLEMQMRYTRTNITIICFEE
jgi:hypothetical protein